VLGEKGKRKPIERTQQEDEEKKEIWGEDTTER